METDIRPGVQAILDSFVTEQAERLAPQGRDAAAMIAEARALLSGGKRLRAAFCFWGFHSVREPVSHHEPLLRACAAIELLHASALVHDDVMDASDTRRGRPSTHRIFEARHRDSSWRGRPEHYGQAAAILMGDLILTWADELLRRSGFTGADLESGMQIFDICRSEVIAGQFLDTSVQARAYADVDTAMTVLRYKSAKYSIERPLQLGAALAGGSAETIEALSRVGLPLGEAFQLRDDVLGIFGDPATTGKPAGDDLVEGKRTVLIALALDGLGADDRATLDAALGRDLSAAEVEHARALIRKSGADENIEAVIKQLEGVGLEALHHSREAGLIAEPAVRALQDLAARSTQRSI